MQHHTLPSRPTLMRQPHHMHHGKMHPIHPGGPAPPPPHMAMNLGPHTQQQQPLPTSQQQQQQQQQPPLPHHMSNGPPLTQQYVPPPPPHIREQQNRLGHPPPPPSHPHCIHSQQQRLNNSQAMHQTSQIQQQHQSQRQLSQINSQQQQQQLQSCQHLLPLKNSNGKQSQLQIGAQQQQRMHQQKQHLQASTHQKPHHLLQSQASSSQQQHQSHYHPPAVVSKSKFQSSTSQSPPDTNSYPKAILQNTNRLAKQQQQQQQKQHQQQQQGKIVSSTATSASSTSSENLFAATTKSTVVSLNQASPQEVILLNGRSKPLGTIITTERLSTIAEVPQEDQAKKQPTNSVTSSSDSCSSTNADASNDETNVLADEKTSPASECSLPSAKEKTPMCLVNELARYNKILHQYRLTGEKGLAHCKRFVVTLKLGEEDYSAESNKIKKAQHLAAAEAIEKTKYKHPVPKTIRRLDDGTPRATITPTVELNALAMKLGQQTYYLFDPRAHLTEGLPPEKLQYSVGPPMIPPVSHIHHHHNAHHRHIVDPQTNQHYIRRNTGGGYPRDQRFPPYDAYPSKYNWQAHRYPMMGPPQGIAPAFYKITLIVGKQKFIGTGRTMQSAKHDAALRALQVLKAQAANDLNKMLSPNIEDGDSKSPISLVHEIGIRRNLSVTFKVLREDGPAHMRNFVTVCTVGTTVTEGEGNGKKISKKRAAEKMLEELKKLPPLSPSNSPVKRIKTKPQGTSSRGGGGRAAGDSASTKTPMKERKKRSSSTSIKEPAATDSSNPISKLIELQQSRKEKEPTYELISKSGEFKRREIVIEVTANGMTARGSGPNKKIAKRNAAQNLLTAIGYDPSVTNSTENANAENYRELANQIPSKETAENNNSEKVVNANSVSTSGSVANTMTPCDATNSTAPITTAAPFVKTTAGQIPGILILRQPMRATAKPTKDIAAGNNENNTANNQSNKGSSPVPSATPIVTPLMNTNASSTDSKTSSTSSAVTSTNSTNVITSSVRSKDQLMYLAQILGFQVNFSDYPKGNHTEFLTIVTLSTVPPQICHGVGANREESQDEAARTALTILSELGLDNNANVANSKD